MCCWWISFTLMHHKVQQVYCWLQISEQSAVSWLNSRASVLLSSSLHLSTSSSSHIYTDMDYLTLTRRPLRLVHCKTKLIGYQSSPRKSKDWSLLKHKRLLLNLCDGSTQEYGHKATQWIYFSKRFGSNSENKHWRREWAFDGIQYPHLCSKAYKVLRSFKCLHLPLVLLPTWNIHIHCQM